jgi:hypothetical protein
LHAGSAPADSIDWLLSTVKQKGVKLVVIDTLQKLLKFKDINDYSEVTNRMEPLLDAARQGNCHITMLHHAGKYSVDDLDAAIGSTAIRGLCYSYLFLKRLNSKSERRIISSDQRGGQKFPETAIGFNPLTQRIEIQGSIEEAEVQDAEPQILEFIETEGGDVTEKAIGAALPVRAIVISKAIRKLFKAGKLDRTGKGRKGSPFHYSVATTLDSLPGMGGMGGKDSGRESKNNSEAIENIKEDSLPSDSGIEWEEQEENRGDYFSGRESDGWEIRAPRC